MESLSGFLPRESHFLLETTSKCKALHSTLVTSSHFSNQSSFPGSCKRMRDQRVTVTCVYHTVRHSSTRLQPGPGLVDVERARAQGQLQLHREFETHLNCMTLCQKTNNQNPKTSKPTSHQRLALPNKISSLSYLNLHLSQVMLM